MFFPLLFPFINAFSFISESLMVFLPIFKLFSSMIFYYLFDSLSSQSIFIFSIQALLVISEMSPLIGYGYLLQPWRILEI
ncbi:unnamed protein product [Auanema sp. JU1783]|nr:unnamed protein product [Auanema sp. JU1783]